MIDLSLSQLLLENESVRARSAHFPDELLASAEQLCQAFAADAKNDENLDSLFVSPIKKNVVAIVQVVRRDASSMRFRILVLGRDLYFHLNDPFAIAMRFPPNFEARGSLPDLEWPPEPLPKRSVAQLQAILKDGDAPFLLGAAQTLVDGGKIVIQRPSSAPELLQSLWALLPESCRRTLWPATFVRHNFLPFDLLVTPVVPADGLPGFVTEQQACDYPDSDYERQLQVAVEAGDQEMLDRLLSRRGSAETLRLAASIVLLALAAAGIVKVLSALNVL